MSERIGVVVPLHNYNVYVTPQLLRKVNKENKRLLDDFVAYLKAASRSSLTINGYISDINMAFVWALQNIDNKSFIKWTKRDVLALQQWLIVDRELSPQRVRRLKSALSSMANFIARVLDDEYPNFRNIINSIESPPSHPVKEKTVWSDEELEELLNNLAGHRQYEKACYVALAMYSGRRKAELCRFLVSDFNDSRLVCDGALYKSHPIKTKGRGGGKYIPCYTLAKKFKPWLDLWLKERENCGIESEWLFPNKNDPTKHIEISTANSWSVTFSRITGKPAYIHSFRHYFTTCLAKAGIPDSVIQTIVAWESSDMVRLYTDLDAEEQIADYFKDGEIVLKKRKAFAEI